MLEVETIVEAVRAVPSSRARAQIAALPSEIASKVLQLLGSAAVLELLEGAQESQRDSILGALPLNLRVQWDLNAQYPSRAVGRFLDPTDAVFDAGSSVGEVVERLREIIQREFVTYGFVVDGERKLVGVLAMRELLFSRPEQRVDDVMLRAPFALQPTTRLEDAVKLVVTKHFPVYPVTDDAGRFLGIVRGARLFEAQAIEITAQPGTMVGVESEERLSTAWKRSFKLRHPWLQINLLTAFLAGAVVSMFQGTIDQLVILASFLPVLAGQSGNTGCQALAVTIRGVTLGDYRAGECWRLVRKEALLGVFNGFFVGIVAGAGMYFMASLQSSPNAILLSLVVLLAMVGSCAISGVSGVLVPLTLKRCGFDPATASSIFLTTATDVASMGMLLGLATALVL
jgi:magnesium transporter